MTSNPRVNIEIYDLKTKEVVRTFEGVLLRSFLFFWEKQCDHERFGYREISK